MTIGQTKTAKGGYSILSSAQDKKKKFATLFFYYNLYRISNNLLVSEEKKGFSCASTFLFLERQRLIGLAGAGFNQA